MDILSIALLAAVVLLALLLVVVLMRQGGGNREAEQRMQQQLALALSQQAETVQRVEKSLREQEQALAKVVAERLDRTEKATGQIVTDLRERLVRIDEAQKKIGELSTQVVSLQEVLSNKQARGAFGEGRLQAIIADALPRDSFAFQHTLSNGRRADCAIFLPGDTRPLLVDSKFPLESITAFREAPTPEARKPAEARLKADVGRHVKDIAERYLVSGETQDVALMFVPSESVYGELHEHFDDLIQQAFRARVILVSPSLLMLAVQVVQAICKDARMREQADLIRTECGKLVADVIRLRERVGNLQKHFGQMTDDVAQALTSADKIAKRGARIEQLEFEADGPAGAPAPSDLFAADTLPTPPLRGAAE